jgi:hypothetical protein
LSAASAQDLAIWPNSVSKANSDQWLVDNHDKIRQMRPRLLVINFANGVSQAKALQKVDQLRAALKESSRYHGYKDQGAPAFLDYQVEKLVDLTDLSPPAEKLDGNSTRYPRVPNWKEGVNFEYGKLYKPEYARFYNIKDRQTGQYLGLKELVDRGIIHEVWFLAYQGKYGAPLESVEVKQVYDQQLKKVRGKWTHAGNGSAEDQPFIGRSLKIVFINVERGPGCAMESLGHSLEWMARCGAVPYLQNYFTEYGGFDLDRKYGLPFDSLYGREGAELNYPNPNTLEFTWKGQKKTVSNYVPVAGNVHFMVNGRRDYDLDNPQPVLTTIEHYRLHDENGKDRATLYTPAVLDQYRELGADCMGRWVIYWRQNMPGLGNKAIDDDGKPMKNWWPFLFY